MGWYVACSYDIFWVYSLTFGSHIFSSFSNHVDRLLYLPLCLSCSIADIKPNSEYLMIYFSHKPDHVSLMLYFSHTPGHVSLMLYFSHKPGHVSLMLYLSHKPDFVSIIYFLHKYLRRCISYLPSISHLHQTLYLLWSIFLSNQTMYLVCSVSHINHTFSHKPHPV